MTLLKPYLNKGHTIFLNNWCTSPLLFERLHELKTGGCGTVRENRIRLPKFDKLKKGSVDYWHTDTLLALKCQDKREVTMLSTVSKPRMVRTKKVHWKTQNKIKKPESVIHYNENIGAVDKSDMQISFVECVRKPSSGTKNFSFICWIYQHSTLISYSSWSIKKICTNSWFSEWIDSTTDWEVCATKQPYRSSDHWRQSHTSHCTPFSISGTGNTSKTNCTAALCSL